jgi:hypothetical protein
MHDGGDKGEVSAGRSGDCDYVAIWFLYSLQNVKNAYRDCHVCPRVPTSTCSSTCLNSRITDIFLFHISDYVPFNFLHWVITVWRNNKLLSWEWHKSHCRNSTYNYNYCRLNINRINNTNLGNDSNQNNHNNRFILCNFFLFGLWGYWHCGHCSPIVPASGDSEDDCGEADGM